VAPKRHLLPAVDEHCAEMFSPGHWLTRRCCKRPDTLGARLHLRPERDAKPSTARFECAAIGQARAVRFAPWRVKP